MTRELSASRQESSERIRGRHHRAIAAGPPPARLGPPPSAATLAPVPTALIAFDFDPLVQVGDGVVAWETIGIAVAIFAALVLAGLMTLRVGLRVDDLFFVVLGIIPGAVIGGRLGYLLLYPSFVGGDPGRLFDPGQGGMELTLAVVGGTITGILTAALLDGRPGRWLHVAALPMLLVLGLGKLAMVLGGTGQGQPTTNDPATAYLGPGPWGSLGPAIPSIPSQAIEGVATLGLLLATLLLLLVPAFRRPDGRAFFVALAGWSGIRLAVASTWRDPVVIGPFRAEQLIDIGVLLGSIVLLGLVVARSASGERAAAEPDRPGMGPASA
jgi:phosphatidylglycerol:prolipoprotein diacylglycerol transferase